MKKIKTKRESSIIIDRAEVEQAYINKYYNFIRYTTVTDICNSLDKEYSFIFMTHPKSDGKIKRSDGMKRGGETQGYSYFNPDVVKDIINNSFTTKDDFNVFVIGGVPSKANVDSGIFKGSKSKPTLTFYNSKVLPNYDKIYLATFDIDGDKEPPEPPPPGPGPGPGPGPTPPPPGPGPGPSPETKKLTTAYILEFGKEEISKVEMPDNDIDTDIDDNDKKRNDLYIVPMGGLEYEDPEFANKKLI